MITHMSVLIEFGEAERRMGPGTAILLERIRDLGSIREAARSLGAGYPNAWKQIQKLQSAFDTEIVSTATGGSRGGGTALTAFGADLLKSFRRIEADAIRRADLELRHLGRRSQKANSQSCPRQVRRPL
ncbi:MAG TPA: LysR family transcriptional regulator [Rhizomicrobium sp.]